MTRIDFGSSDTAGRYRRPRAERPWAVPGGRPHPAVVEPVTVLLLGDTMLGRGVAERLAEAGPSGLFAPEVVDLAHRADLVVANLECCISSRGRPADKVFTFRGPPVAADALALLGVDVVTLANNHSLDFGPDALLDTLAELDRVGITHVGAGPDVAAARAPVVVDVAGMRVGIVALTDHPHDFAAGEHRPGVAFADLRYLDVPRWVRDAIAAVDADWVLVSPHWGPNMVTEPVPHVRRAAASLLAAGADLVAGHSAHVFHGVQGRVIFDLGDFVDDYARDPVLRNDLGIAVLVTVDADGPARLEAVPLRLDYCHTRLATGADAAWVIRRLVAACAALGTPAAECGGRVTVPLR